MNRFPLYFWPHIKNPLKAVSLMRKYRRVFGSDDGKAVLKDILLQAGFGGVTPHGGPVERNEGKRELAAHILGLLGLTEDEMAIYQQDANRQQIEFNQAQMEMTDDRSGY